MTESESTVAPRHILSLSGGKDSTALAIYLRDKIAELEYVFCDTGKELPETYEYLDKLEILLGARIERLNPERPFDHHLQIYRGVLPDARTRWCTRKLKIEPFEEFVGDAPCYMYIGIRADEAHRRGHISTKPNITPKYPFIEDGISHEQVLKILDGSGLGLPKYYEWRSRSGCYFCFFQQRVEWVGLLENHPDLYEKAAAYEKIDPTTGEKYTWSARESLIQLSDPDRIEAIKADYERAKLKAQRARANRPLTEVFQAGSELMLENGDNGCLICHL